MADVEREAASELRKQAMRMIITDEESVAVEDKDEMLDMAKTALLDSRPIKHVKFGKEFGNEFEILINKLKEIQEYEVQNSLSEDGRIVVIHGNVSILLDVSLITYIKE